MVIGIKLINNGPCMKLPEEMFELTFEHYSLALSGLGLEERTRVGVRVKAAEQCTRYKTKPIGKMKKSGN